MAAAYAAIIPQFMPPPYAGFAPPQSSMPPGPVSNDIHTKRNMISTESSRHFSPTTPQQFAPYGPAALRPPPPMMPFMAPPFGGPQVGLGPYMAAYPPDAASWYSHHPHHMAPYPPRGRMPPPHQPHPKPVELPVYRPYYNYKPKQQQQTSSTTTTTTSTTATSIPTTTTASSK